MDIKKMMAAAAMDLELVKRAPQDLIDGWNEMWAARERSRVAKRRQKMWQRRMDRIGRWIGFGLTAYGLYVLSTRGTGGLAELGNRAFDALRGAAGKTRDAAKEFGGKPGEEVVRLVSDTKNRPAVEEHTGGVGGEGANGQPKPAPRETSRPRSTSGGQPPKASSPRGAGAAVQDRPREEAATVGAEPKAGIQPALSDGMKVVDITGVDIGRVQSVETEHFILNRPKGKDLRVPKDACARIDGTVVYLRIEANRLNQQGWEPAE